MFTRKHFEAIARTVKQVRATLPSQDGEAMREAVDILAGELANVFAADNDNFDEDRFLRACDVDLSNIL
jgi:hypothetical protein